MNEFTTMHVRPLVHLLLGASSPRALPPAALAQGDVVKIIKDVSIAGGRNAKGMLGEVLEDRSVPDAEEWGACCDPAWGEPNLTVQLIEPGPLGYYEYGELEPLVKRGIDLAEGDRVRVIADVRVKGFASSLGMTGTVVEVWEQCETDPACCCNELATAPIQVRLDAPAPPVGEEQKSLIGYFADEEVQVLTRA